ncbi:hypothetical protein QF028_002910 [Neobacillus sp. B4I6]
MCTLFFFNDLKMPSFHKTDGWKRITGRAWDGSIYAFSRNFSPIYRWATGPVRQGAVYHLGGCFSLP